MSNEIGKHAAELAKLDGESDPIESARLFAAEKAPGVESTLIDVLGGGGLEKMENRTEHLDINTQSVGFTASRGMQYPSATRRLCLSSSPIGLRSIITPWDKIRYPPLGTGEPCGAPGIKNLDNNIQFLTLGRSAPGRVRPSNSFPTTSKRFPTA